MSQIGVWSITESGPTRAAKTNISLERDLEDWIENDPDLLWSGLTIVGRQITIGGVRLDLLGISPEGQWVCIELKPGTLYRETLTQALDYASLIATMSGDELRSRLNRVGRDERKQELVRSVLEEEDDDRRDPLVTIVGTRVDPGLDRMVDYLADRFQMPIRVVTFDVFTVADGSQILIRETEDHAEAPEPKRPAQKFTVEAIERRAAECGVSELLRSVIDVGEQFGLYIRPWQFCITLNMPTQRRRTLAYARPELDGRLTLGYSAENWTDLYPLTEDDIRETIGQTPNWERAGAAGVYAFVEQLRELLRRVTPEETSE